MLKIQTFLQKEFHTPVMWLVVIGKWKKMMLMMGLDEN